MQADFWLAQFNGLTAVGGFPHVTGHQDDRSSVASKMRLPLAAIQLAIYSVLAVNILAPWF